MSQHVAVLFANEAFYVAFAGRDFEAMQGLWSADTPVTCIHPGWGSLSGRDAVLASWQAIMANEASPEIACSHAAAHVVGDVAYVICHEGIGDEFLIATNVFVREDGTWKLIHHQAGPTPPPPPSDDDEGVEPVQ